MFAISFYFFESKYHKNFKKLKIKYQLINVNNEKIINKIKKMN